MRFESFNVRNYKGVACAQLEGLSTEPVVTISGRNGTGKSLLLEALVGAWAARYQMPPRVGPWGDQLCIGMTLALTEDEWAAVDDWHIRFNGGPAPRDNSLAFEVVADRSGSQRQTSDSTVLQILRNPQFQREHPFGVIDFLPANRLVPSNQSNTVDMGMLNIERVEQERLQMLDQFINQRAPMSLPSVASYLVTLDYQAFLAQRQHLDLENEYGRIAASFVAATGKELLEPSYDPARGSNILIRLPTGHEHALTELSSGEQEMLAMMYFVRRLSAAGGVLFIDEPEQHLHPTLQAALFESMQGLAQRAQVLVVSHSVNLIAAAPLNGLVQVTAPSEADRNQVMRLRDQPGRLELVASLGVTPADLFQSDVLLVVEGDTDAQWLRALFPVELGRSHVMVAGSGGQVLDAHETLSQVPAGIPWLCVRDRDLLTDDEVDALTRKYLGLHVWPGRAIESLLLDPKLIAATVRSVDAESSATAADVNRWLVEDADSLQEEVLAQLVEVELGRQFPPPSLPAEGGKYDRMEAQLRAYASMNQSRADALNDIVEEQRLRLAERWSVDWPKLANPKPLVALTANRVRAFRSPAAFMSALVARAREHPDERPAGLEEFRARLAEILEAAARS